MNAFFKSARSMIFAVGTTALIAACGGGGGDGSDSGGGNENPPIARMAAVLTTDFTSSSLASMPVSDPTNVAIDGQPLHSDSTARAFGSTLFVINRLGADNIQALDAANGYATLWQCSVGNGNNPHDIVRITPEKGYVTLYGGVGVAVVNLRPNPDCTDFIRSTIDLSSLADSDGIPEADKMVIIEDRLYVTLQRLENFVPDELGIVAVIDTNSDTLIGSIPLSSPNPFAETKGLPLDPDSGKILVSSVGVFGVPDGGIERVDPVSGIAEGFFITEQDLGGDINDFVILSPTRGYAIVSDANFDNSLVRFNPSTGEVDATLLSGSAFLPDAEWDEATNQLFVASQDFSDPGVRIFAEDDSEITSSPISVGLPPFHINFVE